MSEPTNLDIFRAAMRHISAAVFAITTAHEGRRYGMIATAVSSLSFEPPSLLVCVNRSASMHGPLLAAEHFCVNVLGNENRDVADQFARSGADRFGVGNWETHEGVPVLANAQSSLLCRAVHRHAFGTHTIFIGELIGAHHRSNARPLTYYDGRYIDISRAPDLG